MSERFVRIGRLDPKSPGMRMRLSRDPGELTLISEESVHREQVNNPDARHVNIIESIWMTQADVEWLYDALGELLVQMQADDKADGGAK